MFVSGENDPCRQGDKAFKKAVLHFKHCGFPNTFLKYTKVCDMKYLMKRTLRKFMKTYLNFWKSRLALKILDIRTNINCFMFITAESSYNRNKIIYEKGLQKCNPFSYSHAIGY